MLRGLYINQSKKRNIRSLKIWYLQILVFAVPFIDVGVTVKSRQSLGKYDELKYFKENENALNEAENGVSFKEFYAKKINEFLNDNFYGMDSKFKRLYKKKSQLLLTKVRSS